MSLLPSSGCVARPRYLTALLVILLTALCWAQKPKTANPLVPKKKPAAAAAPAATATTGAHEMTPEDVAAFLDGLMPQQLETSDIAGAVISVVKDGKVIFAKGYGYSDVAKKAPVSPDSTLFRPGSISKLFTWTAVMQLVEHGKLDLDRDVNDYLDFKIPPTFPQPITLRDIMTHTTGFEETVQQLFVKDAKDLQPLHVYVQEHLPERIFPPFTTPAYSNYATTLAGYVVQRVSGQDYFDYIDEHILKPLNMSHSTFRQPLPADLQSLMSKGYTVASEPAKSFEYVNAAPAGSSSVSAMDITHFMIAHLQNGQYEGTQILKPETAQLMHSQQFANLPSMNGMCLGFYEETRNGHRIIGHGGDTQYFHSDLHLILDAQVGFFISYNSAGKGESRPREAVWHAFLDRYFPYEPPAGEAVANSAQDIQTVSGHYIVSRRAQTTIMNMLVPTEETKVYGNSDGTLSMKGMDDPNGQPKKFREIAPLMFRDVNEQSRIGFKRDSSGNLVAVIDFPFMVFQKSPWYENSALNLPIIIGALAILVLTLILWPVMPLIRWHYGKPLNPLTPQQRRVRLLVRLTCLLFVVFFAGYGIFFSVALKDIGLLSPRGNIWIHLIQILGWLGVLGTLVVLYNGVRSCRSPQRWWAARFGDALVALACLGVIWFAFMWNMLHWNLKY